MDKMAAFLQTIFSDTFSWMKSFFILTKISLYFVLKSPTDNIQALVQIMAWRRIGDKPLSEPMLTWFDDAYMQHLGGDELRSKKVYLHYQSILNTDMAQTVEMIPYGRLGFITLHSQ